MSVDNGLLVRLLEMYGRAVNEVLGTLHTVLAISTKSPENKDLEILDFLIKIDFDITSTL